VWLPSWRLIGVSVPVILCRCNVIEPTRYAVSRYLNPIAPISSHDEQVGERFAIVALFCTLMEFLESCEQGLSLRQARRSAAWSARIQPGAGRNVFPGVADDARAVLWILPRESPKASTAM
jgi:hypothetical protein